MSTAAFSPLHQLLHTYHRAGWHPLPLPPRAKTPPPAGYTGVHGADATPEDLAAWGARYPADSNIGLRMPDGVVGIDVDSYDDKPGAATLAGLVAKLGPLPPTWLSTSRGGPDGPGTSAIALYRVPPGLVARSLGGEGIEIVQHRHRYAVVSPSVHPSGRVYRWFTPEGVRPADGVVPAVADLPELPEPWVQWLATQASDTPAAGSRMDAEALLSHLEAAVELSPCLELISFCHTAAERMRAAGAGGRHDTMTGLVYRLVATCATGHHGWGSGREFLRQLWDVCVGDPSREDEYTRMFTTAAAKVATDWTDGPQLTDPCVTLFAGSMAAPTEPLDLARAGTDRDLARLVLDHQRGRVRFLSDIDRWATYGADEDWHFGLGLSASSAAQVILNRSLDWALSGSAAADKGTDDRRRYDNRQRLSMAAGQGAVASLMTAYARSDTFPGRIRYADLDAEPGVLWAGGQPWDLAASTDRLVRANLDAKTPHLRTAGYTPKHGPAPLWDAFLAAVFPDPGQREWVQLLLGGTLTGQGARVLLILMGEPGTAKTQLLTLVSDVLRTDERGYAVAADRRILSDDTTHASTLMALAGRRLAWIDEGPRRGRASIERLKALTGGGQMTANAMRMDPVTFTPTHTLALTTNDDPEVSDPALLSRVRLVHCVGDLDAIKAARRAIGDLRAEVWQREAPAVLARLIGYAGRWLENPDRAANPVDVQAHLAELAAEQDTVAQWVTERTAPDGWTAASSLYDDYRQFARSQGIPDHRIENVTAWGRGLNKLGVAVRKSREGKARELVLRRFKGPDMGGVFSPVQTFESAPDEAVTSPVTTSAEVVTPENGAVDNSVDGDHFTPGGDHLVTTSGGTGHSANAALTTGGTPSVTSVTSLLTTSTENQENIVNKGVYIAGEGEMSGSGHSGHAEQAPPDTKIGIRRAPGTLVLPAVKHRGHAPEPVDLAVVASALVALIATPEARVTLDVEHTGYPIGHPDYELRTIQLGNAEWCAVLDARVPEHRALAVQALDAAREIHAHSATADVIPLALAAGVEPGRWWPKVTDTGILAALNPPEDLGNPSGWGLKDLAKLLPDPLSPAADKARGALFRRNKWLTDTEADTPVERSGWAQVDHGDPVMVDYDASDVLDTHALADRLLPGIPEAPGLLERERAVQRITARITHRGWRLDPEQVARQLAEHTEQAAHYAEALARAGIANPNSNPQVTKALAAAGAHLPVTKAGNLSATKDVVEAMAPQDAATKQRPRTNPLQTLAADLLDYRHHDTLLSLFLRGFDVQARHGDGRVRPTIYTMGAAATGRMSASRPNVQQIPREGGMRECFLADPGELLVSADFSSVEVRVAAWVSGDLELAAMIRDGLDLHSLIAERVWGAGFTKGHRYAAKRAVFGWIYGAGMNRVALQLGAHGAKARQVVDTMAQLCPGLVQWSAQLRRDVERGVRPYWQHGSGRITWLPSGESHKATNYVVQSTARELLVEALLRLESRIPGLPVVPVHDELVAFSPEALAPYVADTLAECMRFSLPMPDGTFVPIESEPAAPAARWWSST